MTAPRVLLFFLALLAFFVCPGSVLGKATPVLDVRDLLLAAARMEDPEFPDEINVKLTYFAYVGKLQTREGIIYVVDMHAVLCNMPAPRGISCISFFNQKFRFLGRQPYIASHPLWCEKGKLYLWGDLDSPREMGGGNVLDLTDGFSGMRIYHEKAYGSSGGTLDD